MCWQAWDEIYVLIGLIFTGRGGGGGGGRDGGGGGYGGGG